MGEMRNAYVSFCWKNLKEDHAEDLSIDVRVILQLILGK